jgi:hypothetical protein
MQLLRSSSLVAAALLMSAPLAAQQPRASRALAAPNAEIEEPWSGPLQLVELRNGNIVVHDSKEKRLVVVDFRTQSQRDAAREGGGPTEFRSVIGMWRMPGDSVQLLDLFQSRMLILDPTGIARVTRALPGAGDPMAMMSRPMTRSLDASGRWYGEARAMSFEGGQLSMADTALVLRTNPRTMRADTVAKLPSFFKAPQMSAQVMRLPVPGYPAFDAWGNYPDGRVIVVRAKGYVPEIVGLDGRVRRGASLPYARLAITAADKRQMMDSVKRSLDEGMRQAAGAGMTGGQQIPRFELVEPNPWQTEKPPFTSDRILIDPRGRAWVPVVDRTPGQRYDLLDGEGRVVDAIKLPVKVSLLGFGAGSVYTARTDEDDLMYIRRHPLP